MQKNIRTKTDIRVKPHKKKICETASDFRGRFLLFVASANILPHSIITRCIFFVNQKRKKDVPLLTHPFSHIAAENP
ncbi:MAG TPA: hypothetical protein DCG49_06420 [Ruminococcus sp.]|nr:hypothetical protein [Ruminococcus sp.]